MNDGEKLDGKKGIEFWGVRVESYSLEARAQTYTSSKQLPLQD